MGEPETGPLAPHSNPAWLESSPSTLDGTTGQFVINAYMDLVHEINPAMAEIVDFKTGRRADFATGKPKDFEAMRRDVQVRLYHLAALYLLPHPTVMITFHWLADGGPVTVPLTWVWSLNVVAGNTKP